MKTYGSASLKDGFWKVKAEPHVLIRLRRLFGQAARSGAVKLTNTPEVCRDLEWFAERYPLTFKPLDALRAQSSKHREQQTLLDQLLAGVRAPQRIDLAIPPREYQQVAADVLVTVGRYILGDDLGLGKTVSAIGAMVATKSSPVLVVTMTHLVRQWEREIKKFAPALTTHVVKSGQVYDYTTSKRRAAQTKLFSTHPDVLIINYHKLAGWADTLAPIVKMVVFDECQELRTGTESNKGAAAAAIAAPVTYAMGLSATPFYNRGAEFFNVMNVIKPGSLGTREEFGREWCSGENIKNPSAFGSWLRDTGLFLRRTRAEVQRELPELTVVPQEIDSDSGALDAITDSAERLAQLIMNTEAKLEKGEQFRAGGELDMLVRQATGIGKAPHVADFVRLVLESEERVVLFGWHRAVYDIWLERLKDFAPVLYTGTESPTQKEAAVAAFVAGTSRVLIVSLRSGSGLDGLQHVCRTCVFGELDWSPAVHEQGSGRIHRDGQTQPVVAYYLLSTEGSDPIVADVLGVKRDQIEGVRNPHRNVLEVVDKTGDHIKRLALRYLQKNGKEVAA